MKKRILSVLLTVVMIVGMIPLGTMTAFAEELADYTAYNQAVEKANHALQHPEWYETSGFSVLYQVMNTSGNLDKNLPKSKQKEVNDATNTINWAMSSEQLRELPADQAYKNLYDAIEEYKSRMSSREINYLDYTENSWSAFWTAFENAESFYSKNPRKTQREEDTDKVVTNVINSLHTAKNNLQKQPANLNALYDAYITASNIDLNNYKDDTAKSNFQNFLSKAKKWLDEVPHPYGYPGSKQTSINWATEDLVNAQANLVLKAADTTALNTAVEAANAKINDPSKYKSVEALSTLVGTVKESYTILEQAEVNQLVTNINNAIAGLVWIDYEFTGEKLEKFNAMATLVEDNGAEKYTAGTWNDAVNAYNAIKAITPFTYEKEAAINSAYDNFATKYEALVERVDASELISALDTADGIDKDAYVEDDNWTDFESAVQNGQALMEEGLEDLSAEDYQEMFDSAAQAIMDAIIDLTPVSNLSGTDYHIYKNICETDYAEQGDHKGALMGHQDKIDADGVGRAIICLTQDQLDAITAETVTVVGGDWGEETTITVDCAYTYFYAGETKITAESLGCAAFLIIDCDAEEEAISGYGYYAVFNGESTDSADLIVDALYVNPNN